MTLVVALLVAACSTGPSPEELAASEAEERRFAGCQDLAGDITEQLQAYVDQFAPAGSEVESDLGGEVPSTEDLRAAADQFRLRRAALGCEAREFQVLLNRALSDLSGQGPLARAVVAQVRDQVAPVPGPPETVTVAVGDDLAAAVHGAGPGALVELAAGRHELSEPLALLRDTRLVGAGAGRTTVTSAAPGAVVLQAGAGTLSLEGVTLSHTGSEPASVLIVAEGSYDLRDVVLRGGVADADRAAGWGLVIGQGTAPGDGEATDAGEAPGGGGATAPDAGEGPQRLDDVEASDNEAGGVVVTGRTPALRGFTARDNGGCGICWVGAAGGSLTGGTLVGNVVGLSLSEAAAPSISEVTVSDSSEVGVLVESSAGGELDAATLTGNGPVGLAVRSGSSITVRGLVSEDHGEVGVLIEGAATPQVTDIEVGGTPVGVLVRGTAAPALDGAVVRDVTEAHVVYTQESGGTATDARCEADVPGIVLLESADVAVDGGSCEVLDQRDG